MELAADCIFDQVAKVFRVKGDAKPGTPGGLGHKIFNKMQKFSLLDRVAQIEAETGEQESYKIFLEKCSRIALFLKDAGIKQGDIITICSTNNMYNLAIFIACQFIGAVTASLDPQLSFESSKYLLSLVNSKIIFVSRECRKLIENDLDADDNVRVRLVHVDGCKHLKRALGVYTEEEVEKFKPAFIEDLDSIACILFSSGTTGMPKGTCLSHNMLEFNVGDTNDEYSLVVLGYTTLYWFSGVLLSLISLFSGFAKLNCRNFDARTVWNLVRTYKVGLLYMSYSQSMDILPYIEGPIDGLVFYCVVGGQLSKSVHLEFSKKLQGTVILHGYGMTEIGVITKFASSPKLGSTGQPILNGQIIKIVDPETEENLGFNKLGEIRVKFKYQMNGYYNRDSHDCWDEEGFLKTGDLGYFDTDYYLYVVDRIKEMFKYKGWHVIPAVIEEALKAHPDVLHAVVVGKSNIDGNHEAQAIVVKRDGAQVNESELLEYVNSQMDDIHKLRGGLILIKSNDMIYTVTGKINRRQMKLKYT